MVDKVERNQTKNEITFKLEELEPPKELLAEKNLTELLGEFSDKIEASYKADYNLVASGYHTFIHGMHKAYAEHRPFVISPDMIWLLVCQTFSYHINFNHRKGINLFPHLDKKIELAVRNENVRLGDPNSAWHETTQQLTSSIEAYVGKELIDVLRANFSTTGIKERVASEITILDSMKAYFEYVVYYCVCGIPEITLEGSVEDWQLVQTKAVYLSQFKLDNWVKKISPLLNEFVEASKGNINIHFWMNMFKIHTKKEYGNPSFIDGWILDFFPYDKDGNELDFTNADGLSVSFYEKILPKQIICVDFKLQGRDGNLIAEEFPMEYWAGFVGLKQNSENFTIRPEIGWFVSRAEIAKTRREGKEKGRFSSGKTFYNLSSFPTELFEETEEKDYYLNYKGEIDLPNNIEELVFRILEVNGRVPEEMKKFYEDLQLNIFKNNSRNLVINGIWVYDIEGF
ncbi:DUF4419 domain-containing protein [Chondrinema litorale]|uniref:DUF4419 domain-containing protein n=1 Tax=Chondrinema litorale TaxID=2994555 RepID=UPI0025426E74|nr:DUF4419 domain-containing protein [Chondrinema litorale]UZR94316.1 DUF4419 domain-containing protein [Chondrinema litorale]